MLVTHSNIMHSESMQHHCLPGRSGVACKLGNTFEFGEKTTATLTTYYTSGRPHASLDFGGVPGECETNIGASTVPLVESTLHDCKTSAQWNVDLTVQYQWTHRAPTRRPEPVRYVRSFDPAAAYGFTDQRAGGLNMMVEHVALASSSTSTASKSEAPAATTAPPPPPPPPVAPPPNPDLDGDGVLNERDKCPNTRPGAVVDLDGCEVEAVISLEGVHFDFDKATLRPEAIVILDKAVGLLKSQASVVVEVAGHTDSVGSEEYNQALSERRAIAVKDYLESQGITATRLSARGYGEAQPVASNDTDEGRAQNRRVELIVLSR